MEEQPTTAVICPSVHHGNTKKLAEVISEALAASMHSVEEANAIVAPELELIGFGSGIYCG